MEYEIKSEEKGRCLQCGDVIEYGRPDRKFCSEGCKNKFNNLRSGKSRKTKLKIISTLEKNYSILDNLLKINVTTIGVAELQNLGFKLAYFTSYQKIRRHDVFQCFDISFTLISDRVTSIIKTTASLPIV